MERVDLVNCGCSCEGIESSTPTVAEASGGRTSLCAAWSMLLELCRSPRRVSCDSLRFDWRRFDARVLAREGNSVRVLATIAAHAGTVIQLMSAPFIGNGTFLAEVPPPEGDRLTCQSSPSGTHTLCGADRLAGYRSHRSGDELHALCVPCCDRGD